MLFKNDTHLSPTPFLKGARSEYEFNIKDYLDMTLDVLPYTLRQVADYRQLAEICIEHAYAYDRLAGNFSDYARDLEEEFDDELEYIRMVHNIGHLEIFADDIQRVADVFKADLSNRLYRVREIIKDIGQNHKGEEEQPMRRRIRNPAADDPDQIISMFETLY